MRSGFYYISKKGNLFNLTLTDHALEQFIERYYNAHNKQISKYIAVKLIRKIFDYTEIENNNDKLKDRKKRYEQCKGQNSVYLINSEWRFVCELNTCTIQTIELRGKNSSCNNRIKLDYSEEDTNRIFEDGLKELREEYKQKQLQSKE